MKKQCGGKFTCYLWHNLSALFGGIVLLAFAAWASIIATNVVRHVSRQGVPGPIVAAGIALFACVLLCVVLSYSEARRGRR